MDAKTLNPKLRKQNPKEGQNPAQNTLNSRSSPQENERNQKSMTSHEKKTLKNEKGRERERDLRSTWPTIKRKRRLEEKVIKALRSYQTDAEDRRGGGARWTRLKKRRFLAPSSSFRWRAGGAADPANHYLLGDAYIRC